MKGVIGKKIGMTSIFNDRGENIACTVIEAEPHFVTQKKSKDSDGYSAVQIGTGARSEKGLTQSMKGHFKRAGVEPMRHLREFRDAGIEAEVGSEVAITDLLEEGDTVHVVGTSKGKGFQGVVKRHGFKGVGESTHGQHNRERAPGSIGAGSDPSRVYKGMRMGGQTGNKKVKMRNLTVTKILAEENIILIKGSVPGSKNSMVIIQKNES